MGGGRVKTNDEARSQIPGALPPAAGRLLWAQLGLAGVALALALLPLCGRCGSGSAAHAAIAATGVVGYATLVILLKRGRITLAALGILTAGGVHAALGGVMLSGGPFCAICAISAVAALANVVLVLLSIRGALRWVPRVLLPSFSLTWIVAFLALTASAAETRERVRPASRVLARESSPVRSPLPGRRVLIVFEMDGCHYCEVFRREFADRLTRDFPDVDVVYRKAEEELWVRRTPTIALGERVLFEGLPTRYVDLTRAIEDCLRAQADTKR
jgi:hypothetical protein